MTHSEEQQSNLSRLAETDRHNLLTDWFEEQVNRTPENVAVIFEERRFTYAQLNARSNQLAHYLRKLGVGPEVLVGLCMERSVELIVALLGILKAGGAYVPLDPTYPEDRLAFILEDTQIPLLLTEKRLTKNLAKQGLRIVHLDRDWGEIAKESDENSSSKAMANNLAYVIYTSGSTGRPKGVAIEHRSVVALLSWVNTVFTPTEMVGVLASTSISFDLSVFELFAPLSCGGQVILAQNALALPELPAAAKVTLINTVPSAVTELLHMNGIPGSVCTINLAGEPLRPSLVQELYRKTSATKIYDLYGPSEDTTYSTYALRTPTGPQTIGRPISNTLAYVLDQQMQPVPVGVSGELYIAGVGLARGYLYKPDLTAEKFISNPFSNEPGARLYRTGDLARHLTDGSIELLGRIDHQVKIRGFRIELGEIESVLSQHPSVCESVVIVREDTPDDKQLVAYVVSHKERVSTSRELRNFLKEKLPDYMLPSAFVFLEAFPLTFNGKIDRRNLPIPILECSGCESGRLRVAPRDGVELRLTRIWSKILSVRFVGVRDNFFELGGNSLLAVRMLLRVEKEFNRTVSLVSVFEKPTIEELGGFLRHDAEPEKWNWLVLLQPLGSKPPLFLLHVSRELGNQIDKDRPVYGLRPHGLDGKRVPLSVEEMAADYVKEIRMVQPKGPYFIGGYSLGGIVALEVAEQLRKHQQEVSLLLLLDPTRSNSEVRITQFGTALGRLRNVGLRTARPQAVMWRFDSVKHKTKTLICRAFLHAGRLVPIALRQFYCIEVGHTAVQRYTVRTYPGRVALLLTKKTLQNDQSYWNRLVSGDVEIHAMPGEHLDAIRGTYVPLWAQRIRACLNVQVLSFPILYWLSLC